MKIIHASFGVFIKLFVSRPSCLYARYTLFIHVSQSGSGGDVSSVRSGAVREVVEFNKKLALQRRQQHSTFYDRQTKVIARKCSPTCMYICNVKIHFCTQ